jgi:Leucine-rich repeat (LRR) protein
LAQNLGGLTNLRRASFADNEISHIEGGLEFCCSLEELNLEDNRLGSLEGVQGLNRCAAVRVLVLMGWC